MKRAILCIVAVATLIGCTRPSRRPAQPPQQAPVSHRVTIPWLPPAVARFAPLIEEASRRHGLDANLIAVVVLVESGGDPAAESPAGAAGLMQIMPDTATDIADRRGFAHDEARLLEPAYNIDLGSWYLREQIHRFWTGHGDATVARAAGAYNGGPGRMRRHLEDGDALPDETSSYQKWVVGMWRERFMRASPTFAAWWNAGGERLVAGRANDRGLASR